MGTPMSKQAFLLALLVGLAPVETYLIAMLMPFLLVGGFGLVAVVVVGVHLYAFSCYTARETPMAFRVKYAVGAFGLSLLSIELIYHRLPSWLWLWR